MTVRSNGGPSPFRTQDADKTARLHDVLADRIDDVRRKYFSRNRTPFWVLNIIIWVSYVWLQMLFDLSADIFWKNFEFRLITVAIGISMTLCIQLILRRARNWSIGASATLAVALASVAAALFTYMFFQVFGMFNPKEAAKYMNATEFFFWFRVHIFIFLTWAGLYFCVSYYVRLQQQTERTLKAETLAREAQLKMLRYQLNPHFLFNTLNALSTLVLDARNDEAERIISRLSRFLRFTLDSDPMQQVPLSQEVETLNLYLEIEKARFTDRLNLNFTIAPEAEDCLVPNLILQPLIENAIKYAIATREHGGLIELEAIVQDQMLVLHLRDDGPGMPEPIWECLTKRGIGLSNTRERLSQVYDGRARFSVKNLQPSGLEITIRIPREPSGP